MVSFCRAMFCTTLSARSRSTVTPSSDDFAAIVEAYGEFADNAEGLLTAEVISASPLDDRRKDRLRRALSERTGREVRLEIKIDPAIIGGAIAKVGDLVFDGSLRTQLGQLRANLTKGS